MWYTYVFFSTFYPVWSVLRRLKSQVHVDTSRLKQQRKFSQTGKVKLSLMSVVFTSRWGGGGYISLCSAVGCMVATCHHLMCETMVRTYWTIATTIYSCQPSVGQTVDTSQPRVCSPLFTLFRTCRILFTFVDKSNKLFIQTRVGSWDRQKFLFFFNHAGFYTIESCEFKPTKVILWLLSFTKSRVCLRKMNNYTVHWYINIPSNQFNVHRARAFAKWGCISRKELQYF